MPNWCHDTLTVTGQPDELARFTEAVKSDEQPLSFARIVPEPSREEYEAIEEAAKTTCDLCLGTGRRPDAESFGEAWIKANHGCNGCDGTGLRIHRAGWYEWRCEHWGTKWDASFGGGAMALGAETMDVDVTTEAQGVVSTPGVAIYKFDTAWSPPERVIQAASEQYQELEFELQWAEVGNGVAGRTRWSAGVIVEEEELKVEDVLAPEELWF